MFPVTLSSGAKIRPATASALIGLMWSWRISAAAMLAATRNKARAREINLPASLSKWLQEELALLSTLPEIASVPMLKGIDLNNLECTLTMETRFNPVAQDFTLKVPKEVKKSAKSSK